ncbi:SpvB/TcaC N-terminal domain-containing protein [Roseivirga sp. BDSF3-8]|uniref:SpvB/TcaC N-terminal domain-containing protein n=1 Tax=Roseivirga sp. BDSF3-8 TaxID=3241598 RepID=UPI0035324C35
MKTTSNATPGGEEGKKLPDISEHTAIGTLTKEAPSESNQISVPKIELPKGGGAIKGIDEKFEVNAANGTASLSIPFPITPGRHSFGPSLSLSYSSGGGNSPFGLGWSLGLPQISRKTDKGIPRYAGEDIFMMAATEDLVPYLVEDGPGNWVPDQRTEGDYAITRYRPRITSDHSRIELIRHPAHGTYWRATSAKNVVVIYGRSPDARIAHPEDDRKVFTWLPEFSYDDKGNWMQYRYKAEDLNQVPRSLSEIHRLSGLQLFANRYLKHIRYGNAQPYTPDHSLPYDPPLPADDTCYYELVLDYGEHDADTPTPAETTSWPVREDPFSSYRSGFEIRTYRLCHRVLMFHHFPDETNHDGTPFGNDYLVRSLAFDYIPSSINGSGQAEVSYLSEVVASGYVRKGDGSYSKKSMPPLSMNYRHLEWNTHIQQISHTEVENLPEGIGGNYQWIDLYGEGINGLLTEQGSGWYYKDNLGDTDDDGRVTFGSTRPVAPKPGFTGLGSTITIADLDSDGLKEMVTQNGGVQGYYSMGTDGKWRTFQPLRDIANVDISDPNVRMLDITGDGKPDLVMTEERVITYYQSKGKEGHKAHARALKALDETHGPAVVFADEHNKILLADMSGDGLTDIVRIRNSEVSYWPNLGYGRFGAKVIMSNVPTFDLPDRFHSTHIHLADVSGTGATDIIYKGHGHFKAYINQGGNSLSDAQVIEPFFPIDDMVNLQATDLLGTGTTCLVWSSSLPGDRTRPLRYIDLMGSRKPHLLTTYRNNMGLSTTLQYRSSTHFYLKDKLAGTPWITKLPFPVQVVERSTVEDAITNVRFSTRYTYHHGFYDHHEREFRGFGMVEQVDSEHYTTWKDQNQDSSLEQSQDTFQPPVLTRTWYHTGAFTRKNKVLTHFESEYWHARYEEAFPGELGAILEPALPDALKTQAEHIQDGNALHKLIAEEHREASRACKGMVLRTEVFDLKAENPENPTDDELRRQMRPYTVGAHNCRIILQQPRGGNKYACFQVLESEAFQVSYEQDITDPRLSHTLNLETDRYGNVLLAASVAYARFSPDMSLPQIVRDEQARTHITLTRNTYTNDATREVDNAFEDSYRLRMPCENEVFEIRNLPKSDAFYTLAEFSDVLGAATTEIPYLQSHSNAPERRKIEHSHTLYLADDLSGPLNPGELQPRAITHQSYALAYTPDMLADLFPAGFIPDANYPDTEGHYEHFDGDSNWWVPSGRTIYLEAGETLTDLQNRFWQPVGYRDPAGSEIHVTYYKTYYFLNQSLTDPLGNTTQADAYNFRILAPVVMRDPNDTLTGVVVDELGLVKATALLGKDLDGDGTAEMQLADTLSGLNEWTDDEEADIQSYFQQSDASLIHTEARNFLGQASSRYVYHLHAWTNNHKPAVTCGIMRETHHAGLGAGEESALQIAYEYTDGMGNVAMTKVKAEPGEARQTTVNEDGTYNIIDVDTSPDIRWLGNGRTVLNNKGNMVKQYQPYFSVSPAYEDAPELVETGQTFILYYDSLGRHIRTLFPDKTLQEIHFDAWKKEIWDQNDMVLQSEWYNERFNRLIDAELTADGKDPAKEEATAVKAAAHDSTPPVVYFDTLGRPVMTEAHNKRPDNSDEFIRTTIALDIEGNTLSLTDARSNPVMTYRHNMLGGRVYSDSMDAGERWFFSNALGKLLRSLDQRDHVITISYDALHRETEKRVTGGDGPVPLDHVFEKFMYGEGQANDRQLSLRGKVWHHYDTAGKVESVEYDQKGNLTRQFRRFAEDYKAIPDWSIADPDSALQAGPGHETIMSYDALKRVVSKVNPDGSEVANLYNERGKLNRVEVTRHGNTIPYIKDIDYNEKDQRKAIIYGNDVKTTYAYDRGTFRLLSLTSRRLNNELLQELHYTYDAVGNITETEDRAIPTRFFSNQIIEPRSRYTYDALYRLTEAQGKEHVAQVNHNQCDNWNDLPFLRRYSPNNDMQWRNYTQRYTYDVVGNILQMRHIATGGSWTRTYSYEANTNRLTQTQVGAHIYTYDHHPTHGFITDMPHLQDMEWNFRDELQQTASQQICTGTEPETTYYVYNSSGKRVRKITENQAVGNNPPAVKDERLYVGDIEIYTKVTGTNAGLERTTLHISDDQGRIAMIDTRNGIDDGTDEETVRYQLGNRSNSVHLELDHAGEVISYEEYHPYGTTAYQAVSNTIRAAAKRYRYTGMERDQETGLSYHNARYYMPWLGRWLKPDPAGIQDGINKYSYVTGNPVRMVDPYGLDGWDRFFGVVKAVGGVIEVGAGGTLAAAGVATGWTGVGVAGAVGGTAVALHGVDTIQSGLRTAFGEEGEHVDSVTSTVLQSAGMSPRAANLTDAGIGIVGTLGAGAATRAPGLVAASRVPAGESLVHVTTQEAAAAIRSSQTLGTGSSTVYAGTSSLGEAGPLMTTVRTGLLPSQATTAVEVAPHATGAFRAPAVVGPMTAWQRASGAYYTAEAGSVNLATGAFEASGVAVNQMSIYALDAVATTGIHATGALNAESSYSEPVPSASAVSPVQEPQYSSQPEINQSTSQEYYSEDDQSYSEDNSQSYSSGPMYSEEPLTCEPEYGYYDDEAQVCYMQ